MKGFDDKFLDYLLAEQLVPSVFKGEFGLEKENVRVDERGRLALTPHPIEFGNKLKNPYITTDFSESQIEMITPVCYSIPEVYNFLENLQNIVSVSLKGEYLWPQSNPPILPSDEDIPIAEFGVEGLEQRKYREKLAKKYGKKKQLLSGIHCNFSFSDELLLSLYEKFGHGRLFPEFKNNIYLKVTKNFLKYRWLLIYLTGASPIIHRSFGKEYNDFCRPVDDESYYYQSLCSIRNSQCGYKNQEEFLISYETLEDYTGEIQALIDEGKIENASEFYSPIRLKTSCKEGGLNRLKKEGIGYVELRIFDLNPFVKNGITIEDLYLTHLLMIYCLLKPNPDFSKRDQDFANLNHDLATVAGVYENSKIYNDAGKLVSFKEEALEIFMELEDLVRQLGFNVEYLTDIIQTAKEKVMQPEQTYASILIKAAKKQSYIGFHMQKAKEYLEESKANEVKLIGYGDLELSTQMLIQDAIKRGIIFDILDRRENFLSFNNRIKKEYVKQATMTSLDSYSTVLIMENKVVTKQVLKEHNFKVPLGENYDELESAKKAYKKFKGKKIVVKPKSTNFGVGISILDDDFREEEYNRALEIALSHDDTALVEEFISGKEYRFLVIGDEVVGVLLRVPANVQGDGRRTIRQLVEEKNLDPLRGEGHRTPLEKIVLGEIEEMCLKSQGKSFEDIPRRDEVVFIRENSNISTGGDSIDYTELVHDSYKQLALEAAKCIGVAITGVDIIIENIRETRNETNCTIIELNFNPAIYMHCYPYRGKNRRVGDKVLDLLFGNGYN